MSLAGRMRRYGRQSTDDRLRATVHAELARRSPTAGCAPSFRSCRAAAAMARLSSPSATRSRMAASAGVRPASRIARGLLGPVLSEEGASSAWNTSQAGSSGKSTWFLLSSGTKRASGIAAASLRPSSNGTRMSPRQWDDQCRHGAASAARSQHVDALHLLSSARRLRPLPSPARDRPHHRCCSGVPSGINRLVKNRQNAGLSRPQPMRTKLTRVSASSRSASVWLCPRSLAIGVEQHQMRDPLGVPAGHT